MILFGGRRYGQDRFCNDRCATNGIAISKSRALPPAVVHELVQRIWRGDCPKCNGPGPVDVHTSHTVFSLVIVTSWQSKPQVSCRRCGLKSQAGAAALSLVAGWWGFPWGLVVTPVQVGRNVLGMVSGPRESEPSAELQTMARVHLGSQTH